MSHTLVALLQDHPGVLHRVVSLFRRRGYNIESVTVGRSEAPGVSRMTLVVDAENVEQVIKQFYRLIEVLKVQDVTDDRTVERETVLVKVHASPASRAGLIALTGAAGAKVADVGVNSLVFEVTDTPDKVETFIDLCRPLGIKEMIRSGRIAMVRGQGLQPGRGSAARPRSSLASAPALDPNSPSYNAQADGEG